MGCQKKQAKDELRKAFARSKVTNIATMFWQKIAVYQTISTCNKLDNHIFR